MKLSSSAFSDAIYDYQKKELRVKPKNSNDFLVYEDFPQDLYGKFLLSKSKGQFYAENIKGGKYKTRDEA